MTTKSDVTEEKRARVGRAPVVAWLAIPLADPGGPIEAAKDGGFVGFGAQQVSEREQVMLERVRHTVSG